MPTATLTGIPTEKVVKIQYHYHCMLSQIFAWNSVVRHSWLGILQGLILLCTGLPERMRILFWQIMYQDGHTIQHMLFLDKFIELGP